MPSTSHSQQPETLADIFRKSNEWLKIVYTPLFVTMASNTITLDEFTKFVAQDQIILRSYKNVYKVAIACTDDDNIRFLSHKLLDKVDLLSNKYQQALNKWGITLPIQSDPICATTEFTNFIVKTVTGKIEGVPDEEFTHSQSIRKLPAYGIATMSPLMDIYSLLGRRILPETQDGVDPIYHWINYYNSREVQEYKDKAEMLLEELRGSLTNEDHDIIEQLYSQAMDLVKDFFLAHTPAQRTVVPLSREHNPNDHRLLLFTGFEVLNTDDSSSTLIKLARARAPRSRQRQSESQPVRKTSREIKYTWNIYCDWYAAERDKRIESVLVGNEENVFNYDGLYRALEDFSEFEKLANTMMIDLGVLKGLTVDDINLEGASLVLHTGSTNFFKSIAENGNLNAMTYILSDCLCGDLIRSSLASGGLHGVNVYANELVFENSLSTGGISRKIESPIDRVQTFTEIIGNFSDGKKNLTVYIGSSYSVADFLCLLKADIGIVACPRIIIDSDSLLKRVANHFRISIIPLLSGVIERQKLLSDWKDVSGVIYAASSWSEVRAFIMGL